MLAMGAIAQDSNNHRNVPDMQALKLMLRILYTAEKVKLLSVPYAQRISCLICPMHLND